MPSEKHHHILSAGPNLIAICFAIITALKVTHLSRTTFADEISAFAALNFLIACILSYVSIRTDKITLRYERWADCVFLLGLCSLFVGIISFYVGV